MTLHPFLRGLTFSGAFFFAAATFLSAGPPIKLVDVATDVTDPSNLRDTEPSVAVNPKNPMEIAIVSFSESWGPNSPAPVWKSTDGGATWTKVKQIPQPPTNMQGPGDQKIAFDAAGNLYLAELDFGVNDFIYRQTGGANAALTPGASYGNDQPHLDLDKSALGACFNRLYSPWLNFNKGPEQSTVSFSTNSGVAMTDEGAGDNSAFPNRTTRIALGPDGKAYVIYKTREGAAGGDFENAHFRVNRSDDCGASWGALGASGVSVHGPTAVQTFFTQNFGNPAKGLVNRARSSDAWIAIGSYSNTIYAAYVNKDTSGFAQIFVAGSSDEGKTWTSTRVTDGTHHSAFPELAVTSTGVVGLLFIDYDDSGAKTIFRHHFAVSSDGGASWTEEILQSMDPGSLSNAVNGFIWGDYEGLTALGATLYGVFTGQSIGRSIAQLDPIFFKAAYPIRWWILKFLETNVLRIPVPWPCLQCPPVPYYNIFVDGDPGAWSVRLTAPENVRLQQEQVRTRTGVVISLRAKGIKLESLGLRFERNDNAKAADSHKVKVRVAASARPVAVAKSHEQGLRSQ